MISWHGLLFKGLDYFWKNIRAFAFENKTLFEVFFIFLYTVQQAILIWLTYTAVDIQELGLIISVFSLIVLTTFSLHKLLMGSRIKYLEKKVAEADSDKRMLEEEIRSLNKSHSDVIFAVKSYFERFK